MASTPNRSYDIFSGLKDKEPMWLEATNSRESAYERMLAIALEKPGSYFVFCMTTNSIICAVDTTLIPRMTESKA
jgi:hypothetical protein